MKFYTDVQLADKVTDAVIIPINYIPKFMQHGRFTTITRLKLMIELMRRLISTCTKSITSA